jgi:hypothetical protein
MSVISVYEAKSLASVFTGNLSAPILNSPKRGEYSRETSYQRPSVCGYHQRWPSTRSPDCVSRFGLSKRDIPRLKTYGSNSSSHTIGLSLLSKPGDLTRLWINSYRA